MSSTPTLSYAALAATFWRSLAWEEPDNLLPHLIDQLHHLLENACPTTGEPTQRAGIHALLAASYWQLGQCPRAVAIASQFPHHPLSSWVLGSWDLRQGNASRALSRLSNALGHYPALDEQILASIWEGRRLCTAATRDQASPSWRLKSRWLGLMAGALLTCMRGNGDHFRHYTITLLSALLHRPHWETRLSALATRYPGCSLWRMLLGDGCLMADPQTSRAQVHYAHVLTRHPAHVEALRRLIFRAEAQDDILEAHLLVDRLGGLVPMDPEVACHRGNLATVRQDYAEALTHYHTALILSQDARWQVRLLHTMADLHLDHLEDGAAAQQALLHALALNPDDLATRYRLCALLNQHNQLDTARLLCQQAIVARPKLAQWHTSLAFLAWRQDDLAGARQAYEQALTLNPRDEVAANNLAVIYLDMEAAPTKAIALLEQIVTRQPRYALAYFNLGRAYSQVDRFMEAAQAYQQAQSINQLTGELDAAELNQRIADLFRADGAADHGITVP